MSIPSIYINLEDDVSKVFARIKRTKSDSVVLVCPKRCFLFSDSINLRLLKKQVDLLKKEVFILTMDERGQMYAKEAGFSLKFLPKTVKNNGVSDIGHRSKEPAGMLKEKPVAEQNNQIATAVKKEIKNIAKFLSLPKVLEETISKGPDATQATAKPIAEQTSLPKVGAKDAFFPQELEQTYRLNKKSARNRKTIVSLVAASLILVLLVVFVVLPKAVVVVYPKTEPITRDMEVSVGTVIKEPDPARLVMPGVKFTENLETTDKFQATGKKEVGNKASGTIQIYNFTGQPLSLKSATTLLTVGSKNYKLDSDLVALRPTGYKNSKTKEVDPATLGSPVEITASEGGEGSNLPAGTRLEITNQVFGSRPQVLYAKSFSDISGGTSRYLSVISSEDITKAQGLLIEKLLKQQADKLSKDNLVLLEKAYLSEVISFTADKPAGTESPTFEAALKIKLTGLAFNRQQLQKLVYDRIGQTLASNKSLEKDKDGLLTYKVKDINSGFDLASLTVHFQGRAVFNINLGEASGLLVGKSKSEVNEILRSKNEVDKIEITLAPAWQRNFPWFAGKIEVKIGQ